MAAAASQKASTTPLRRMLLVVAVAMALVYSVLVFLGTVALPDRHALRASISNTPIHPPSSDLQAASPTPTPKTTPTPSLDVVTSVLHPRTTVLPPLTAGQHAEVGSESRVATTATDLDVVESTDYFPQHGKTERGIHWRLQNRQVLGDPRHKTDDSLLVMVVLKDHQSWGVERSSADLFEMLATFTHPKAKTSLTLLVSDMKEFDTIQHHLRLLITAGYAQFSLLFRSDLDAQAATITRDDRHKPNLQRERRRMLARYRNFALLSTLQSWHQHVVWLDADVYVVPPALVTTMITSGRDIVEPVCFRGGYEYDLNSWVGTRTKPADSTDRAGFVPRGANDRHMVHYGDDDRQFIPLDSVGGTMLYVRADIHRQGVLFTHHYVIGSEWDAEGYDGIETEGLCYAAHFLGFKCWGMPHDAIQHVIK